MRRSDAPGFTLVEVLVVIGIIGALIALLLPMAEKARERAYVVACSNNLRSIGQAFVMYANANRGAYPRTTYVPGAPLKQGTGTASADMFGPTSQIAPNDVTASIWLLARAQRLPTSVLLCAYNDESEFTPDKGDPQKQGNFTDWKKNLGYSFANPYPEAADELAGYRLSQKLPAGFALAADLNPGKSRRTDPTAVTPGMSKSEIKRGNSLTHELRGQNVLYVDGHVTFQFSPFCGLNGDNIYTNGHNRLEASPSSPTDTVLVPSNDD